MYLAWRSEKETHWDILFSSLFLYIFYSTILSFSLLFLSFFLSRFLSFGFFRQGVVTESQMLWATVEAWHRTVGSASPLSDLVLGGR